MMAKNEDNGPGKALLSRGKDGSRSPLIVQTNRLVMIIATNYNRTEGSKSRQEKRERERQRSEKRSPVGVRNVYIHV